MEEESAGMRILLALQLGEDQGDIVPDDRIVYRPDLDRSSGSALAQAVGVHKPDVLITREYPDASVGAAWRRSIPQRTLVAIATSPSGQVEPGLERLGVVAESFRGIGVKIDGPSVIAFAERTWTRVCTGADLPRKLAWAQTGIDRSVVLVGAGIVNLVTALHLQRQGYEVDVYDACPDPRQNVTWSDYGCTRGGDNARMFTLTEADDYHDKDHLSSRPNAIFDSPISEGGWQICRSRTDADLEWVEDFRAVPPWLACTYTDDILRFNREGGEGWRSLMERESDLFEDVELRENILRLYTQRDRLRSQIARQDRLGATTRVLSVSEIADRHPALREACASGELVGGIEVVGFTVGVHDLVERILARLELGGAVFHWSTRVEGISWSPSGLVEGLMVEGEPLSAGHYVLSPGAYGAELLGGTASEGLIHGVLGAWLTLPNLEPRLEHSLKIARSGHLAEDSNVTVGRDANGQPALIVGSGYGWTGADPTNIDPMQIETLRAAVDDTARRFLPRSFESAQASGLLEASRRVCVRPWTASNLPIFEIREAVGGGALMVAAGHNTGGFAQAPAVAAAVSAALDGDHHPMHVLYDPLRLRNMMGRGSKPASLLA